MTGVDSLLMCPLEHKLCIEDKCAWWTEAHEKVSDTRPALFMCAVKVIAYKMGIG